MSEKRLKIELNEELTRQVAHLARLELTPDEIRIFTPQLGKILGYVEQLQEVDVTGIEPLTYPIALETPLRDDSVVPSPVDAHGKPKVLGSAPDVFEDGFKVPPIL